MASNAADIAHRSIADRDARRLSPETKDFAASPAWHTQAKLWTVILRLWNTRLLLLEKGWAARGRPPISRPGPAKAGWERGEGGRKYASAPAPGHCFLLHSGYVLPSCDSSRMVHQDMTSCQLAGRGPETLQWQAQVGDVNLLLRPRLRRSLSRSPDVAHCPETK